MNNVDERLERIENRVELLLERQRLSRFDTLMFLAYPMVILGITVFTNAFLQYEVTRSIMIMDVPLATILDRLVFLFPVGFSMMFLLFVLAYATDDLTMRLVCVRSLVVVLGCSVGSLALAFLNPWLADLGAFSPTILVELPIWSTFTGSVAVILLIFEASYRLAGWVASWFERSIPLTLETAQISLEKLRLSARKWRGRRRRLLVKAFWSASFAIFCVVVVLAARAGGLNGKVAWDAACGIAFLVPTEAIMLWRL